jgi:hypothetical protein
MSRSRIAIGVFVQVGSSCRAKLGAGGLAQKVAALLSQSAPMTPPSSGPHTMNGTF